MPMSRSIFMGCAAFPLFLYYSIKVRQLSVMFRFFEKEMGSSRSQWTVYLFPKEWSILSHIITIRGRKNSMNRSKERHLFLTSSGLTEQMKRKLFSVVGKRPEEVKVLYIPTAGIETDGAREGFGGLPARTCSHGDSPEAYSDLQSGTDSGLCKDLLGLYPGTFHGVQTADTGRSGML